MTTRRRWRTLDTAFGAVNRPTAERSDLASRSAKRPDLGAAYSETGSCGSEEGRAQRCADLFHMLFHDAGSPVLTCANLPNYILAQVSTVRNRGEENCYNVLTGR
jgi:hypothetical protein